MIIIHKSKWNKILTHSKEGFQKKLDNVLIEYEKDFNQKLQNQSYPGKANVCLLTRWDWSARWTPPQSLTATESASVQQSSNHVELVARNKCPRNIEARLMSTTINAQLKRQQL